MTKRGPYTREKKSAWAKAGRGQHPLEEATQKISPHRCYTTAVNSAYTEAHEASGRLVVANDGTDVGKGQRKRSNQEPRRLAWQSLCTFRKLDKACIAWSIIAHLFRTIKPESHIVKEKKSFLPP